MAQCMACLTEIRIYDRRCRRCGAQLRREVRSHDERQQARLCHLLPLPGMLIFFVSWPVLGPFSLAPFNLIAPLIYRSHNPTSQTIQTHTREVLNFQLLWTAVIGALWIVSALAPPLVLSSLVAPLMVLTWVGGVALTVFLTYDLGNGGTGRYPLRLPLL